MKFIVGTKDCMTQIFDANGVCHRKRSVDTYTRTPSDRRLCLTNQRPKEFELVRFSPAICTASVIKPAR